MIEAPGISLRGAREFFQRVVAAAAVVAALGTAPAVAAPPPPGTAGGHVRLLQPTTSDPRARRCLTRLREELEAGGFTVTTNEFGVGGEGLWMVDPPSPRDGSIATITLIGNPDVGAAELWIVNGVPWGRAVVRRLLVPAGAGTYDDEVVAIRALEFLRASALELAATRPSSTATTTAATATRGSSAAPADAALSPPSRPVATNTAPVVAADAHPGGQPLSGRPQIALELGVSLLDSAPEVTPAFLPVARVRAEWLSLLETRLSLAGFGTHGRVTNVRGSAGIGHLLGLFELRTSFRSGRVLRPAIGAGAGVLRVNVDGSGNPPFEGLGGQRWAALFDVGAGLTVRLGTRLSVAFEAHGQLATPVPAVRFAGEEAARLGRPALFTSVTLVTPL